MEIMQALLYIGFLFSFFLIFYKLIFPSSRVQLQNLPPSPPRIPILGHLHLFKKPFHRALHNLSEKYGSVLLLWFGWRPVLVISTPSAIEECFTKNDLIFANRPLFPSTTLLEKDSPSLAMSPYGPHWRNLRRFATIEIFSSARIQMTSRIRADEVRCLVKNLFARGNCKVEVNSLFYVLTFNIMMKMVSGERYFEGHEWESEKGKGEINDIKQTLRPARGGRVGDFFPFLKFVSSLIMVVTFKSLSKKRDVFLQNLIDTQRRKKWSSSNTEEGDERRKNIIHLMLSLQESEPEFYTDDVIKATIKVMFQAGVEISITTLEAVVSFLISHPNEFNKARDEIDSYVGKSRVMDDGDLSKLTYLHCIINETLRLGPTMPLNAFHESSKECVVGGFSIPSGTMLIVNTWALHNDPRLWGDPTLFKPERFVGVEGEKLGFKLFPFGSGRRACPGESLAKRFMALTLGTLIQCFDWEKGEENFEGGGNGNENGKKMGNENMMHVVFRPRKDLMDTLVEL